jgi:hypothetical protein
MRWLLLLLGTSAVAGTLLVVWLRRGPVESPSSDSAFPPPPYSTSRYLNTRPEARYIGADACAKCHPRHHQSYLLTPHSKALSDLDPKAEPPDGSFTHQRSGFTYRVYRRDNQLRHEEVLRSAEGHELARLDLPVRYLIGSGHFTRSYLVEVDGFLHESPITWYPAKQKWDVSPGYDVPVHWSFERPIALGCLTCHAGRVERDGNAVNRLVLHEKAIGCENCHGPGSLHQDRHRDSKRRTGEDDLTIVNPGKLSRPLQEAICAVCHLSGPATVLLRGRQVNDYRPGTPLTDYRVDYRFDSDSEKMTVVGHVEQLRQSRCYQQSPDLTCVTCHDPHRRAAPKDPVAFYREKCLSCHTTRPCRLDQAQRLEKDATDNCAACHMPRGDTEIPHVAFTHHRIGRHSPAPVAGHQRIAELVPMDDVSHLPALERQRNLGLAYAEVARNERYHALAGAYRERARSLLETVRGAGLREGVTAQALALLYHNTDSLRASAYAREALEATDLPVDERAVALQILAYAELKDENHRAAGSLLEELVTVRHFADDWRRLGVSHLKQNQPRLALPALQKALAIRPSRYQVHAALAEAYQQLGEGRRASEHRELARALFAHKPK